MNCHHSMHFNLNTRRRWGKTSICIHLCLISIQTQWADCFLSLWCLEWKSNKAVLLSDLVFNSCAISFVRLNYSNFRIHVLSILRTGPFELPFPWRCEVLLQVSAHEDTQIIKTMCLLYNLRTETYLTVTKFLSHWISSLIYSEKDLGKSSSVTATQLHSYWWCSSGL